MLELKDVEAKGLNVLDSSLNCTMLELKVCCHINSLRGEVALNCTMLELKGMISNT